MPTILVVEHNDVLAQFACDRLRGIAPEHKVVSASTWSEARRLAQEYSPEVVVIDWCLPDTTGAQAIEQLKSLCPNARTVVTTETLVDSVALAPQSPIAAILTRPFHLAELSECVRSLLPQVERDAVQKPPRWPGRRELVCLDAHRLKNRLSGLLVGLRALGADMDDAADDPRQVRALSEEYVMRLGAVVSDLTAMVEAGERSSRE